MIETPILIVGGGPVGLNLGLNLAQLGQPFVLMDAAPGTRATPAGSGQNSRTMEHYRRLGLSRKVRQTGLPPGHSTDVVFVTRVAGFELSRVKLPPVDPDPKPGPETALTPEPLHRANQKYVEAVLKAELETRAGATLNYGWRLERFSQDADGVTAEIAEMATGERETVRARYMVGCDGGRSLVRETLGIGYEGEGGDEVGFMQGRMLAVYYRAPALRDLYDFDEPWQFQSMNPDGRASIITLDGKGEYLSHAKLRADDDPAAVDPLPHLHAIFGCAVPVEIIAQAPWTAGLSLVAESYGQGRVLLAGDAAHLFTPTGGFGMNTGVDDAANLGWKLAALVQGWGGPALLGTYESERRPIAVRNLAQSFAFASVKSRIGVPDNIEDDTLQGAEVRARLGAEMVDKLAEEFLSIGIQLGARYDGSPLIVPDGAMPPPDEPFEYVPSACPGGRAPHAWLADGRALMDAFGPGFTLLTFGQTEATGLAAAAKTRGVPLTVAAVPDDAVRELYEADAALIRPDGHVAWRGNAEIADPDAVLAAATGHGAGWM